VFPHLHDTVPEFPAQVELVADLGPLPHARLNIDRGRDNKGSDDRPRKQKTRMLKAECVQCETESRPYVIRLSASTARDPGPPACPKHGTLLMVNRPERLPACA
jgi:hypothetical protein